MLSVNGKTSRDVSRINTTYLIRPGLKVKEVFNQQISGREEVLIEVMC